MADLTTGNSDMKLMTEPLNGHNHTSWARAITIFLTGKGKLHHLTGSAEPSTETSAEKTDKAKEEIDATKTIAKQHKNTQQWLREDNQVMSWLLGTMIPQISKQFLFCNSAQEIWEKVQERYGQVKNFAHIFTLKQELGQIKQGQQSISELVGVIDTKWDELQMHNPLTTDLKALQVRAEQEKTFYFLAALDPSYENLKSQILSGDLISFNHVASVIQREESRRIAMNSQNRNPGAENHAYVTGFQNHHKARSRENSRSNEWCNHCKRTGHIKERCWVLHPELRPAKGDRGGDKRKGFAAAMETKSEKAKGTGEVEGSGAGLCSEPITNWACNFSQAEPKYHDGTAQVDKMQLQQLLAQNQQLMSQLCSMMGASGKCSGSTDREEDW